MSDTWKLMALKLGISCSDKSIFTCADGVGTYLEIPIWSVAIWNDEHKIIVDTGYHDDKWVVEYCNLPSVMKEEEKIQNIIKDKLGWSVDDVDIVINTHLHYDHCGNNNLFKNAKFYVSRTEWDFANNPLPSQRGIYYEPLFDYRAVQYFDWNFIDGEAEILPGIMAFPTPGHTPGHMSLIVKTEEGVVCVAGDCVNLVENIRDNKPPQISYSNVMQFNSYDEIRKRAEFIIPGHECWAVESGQTSNFPKIRG